MSDQDDDTTTYRVVLNHEEQYSIYPVDRDLPDGWRAEGTIGPKADCLAHIDRVWTDMRPLSLRRHMEETARREAAGEIPAEDPDDDDPDEESLVTRLSRDGNPVEISLRPEPTGPAVRDAIERGHVFVRFVATRGTTELGVQLDSQACVTADADFDRPHGTIRLVGDLVLDFESVRCTVEIDLATMSGTGRLALRAAP